MSINNWNIHAPEARWNRQAHATNHKWTHYVPNKSIESSVLYLPEKVIKVIIFHGKILSRLSLKQVILNI